MNNRPHPLHHASILHPLKFEPFDVDPRYGGKYGTVRVGCSPSPAPVCLRLAVRGKYSCE